MSKFHDHAIVWMDHQQARIFQFDAAEPEATVVHSSHPHQHLHHKANSNDSGHVSPDKHFLQQICTCLSDAGSILLTGPAGAKQELRTYLDQHHPQLAARIAGVQALDHPSDGELLALARKFFKLEDRMHSQFRTGMHQ